MESELTLPMERDELRGLIAVLEQQCLEQPENADLRTCLGMAQALHVDGHRPMDGIDEPRPWAGDPKAGWSKSMSGSTPYVAIAMALALMLLYI